jgi:hypothetical protein
VLGLVPEAENQPVKIKPTLKQYVPGVISGYSRDDFKSVMKNKKPRKGFLGFNSWLK